MRESGLVERRVLRAAALVVSLALAGCMGPTQTLQQGKDLCGAGIQYTGALDKLLDTTIEIVIDSDSDELIRQRTRTDPNELAGSLQERNKVLLEEVKTLETFRLQEERLKAYFVSLQGLIDAKVQDSAAAAVESLSDSIAAANQDLRTSHRLELSEKERADLGQMGGLVAKNIHAAAVRRALQRDAPVIGEQFILHEKLLDKLKGILEDRYTSQVDAVANQKVKKPYVNVGTPIGDLWKEDRKQWIRSSFCAEELTRAMEACRHMRFIWAGILQGEPNVTSLQLVLNNIHDFTAAAQALQKNADEREN